MGKRITILLLIALVVGLPLALQRKEETIRNPDEVLVIISPHNEHIRREFTLGFREWYRERTGKTIAIDWRSPGGTSEIIRYLDSEYTNAFRLQWERDLRRRWTAEVQDNFSNRRLRLPLDQAEDSPGQAARRAFLEGQASIGIDLFFGGGSYDFGIKAAQGQLVPSRILQTHPEWFGPDSIPDRFGGETLYDPEGRWVGAVLSSFGIIYNRELIKRLGFEDKPSGWRDLADPRFMGLVAVADPSKSGSINKAFEMMVQEQMQGAVKGGEASPEALAEGWMSGMRLIQLICANGRYFTDSATKPILDVARGNCAIGMAIDFYGRFQEQNLQDRSGSERFAFFTPQAGSAISADPIGILRGAPNPELAEAFIEYTLSLEGQKLWGFKPGEAGGPRRNALRRSPIRRELYAPEWQSHLADPEVNPYEDTSGFTYQPVWTGPLFNELRFIIKAAFIDPHPELKEAWAAIEKARQENRLEDYAAALAILQDLSAIDYAAAQGQIKEALSGNALQRLQLENALNRHFTEQYRKARERANLICPLLQEWIDQTKYSNNEQQDTG